MVVTLEWVRDNYDVNKSRYIESDEAVQSATDFSNGLITDEQHDAVQYVADNMILLPEYTITEHVISFIVATGVTLKIGGVEIL